MSELMFYGGGILAAFFFILTLILSLVLHIPEKVYCFLKTKRRFQSFRTKHYQRQSNKQKNNTINSQIIKVMGKTQILKKNTSELLETSIENETDELEEEKKWSLD